MNGYLRIKNTDLYERDGVTYWRNGGNIIGNVVKAVIEENDVVTSETYYIESLKTAKPIMLDPDVKIGGLTASESKNGNFIIVETAPADFTEYGGGAGLKITFIYGVNYYSIETVEANGDIKIYDPNGESGTITPDALPDTIDAAAGDVLTLDSDKKPVWGAIPAPTIPELYLHTLCMYVAGSASVSAWYIDQNSGATTVASFAAWLNNNGFDANTKVYPFTFNDKEPSIDNLIVGVYSSNGTSISLRNVNTTAFTPNIRLFNGQTTRIL